SLPRPLMVTCGRARVDSSRNARVSAASWAPSSSANTRPSPTRSRPDFTSGKSGSPVRPSSSIGVHLPTINRSPPASTYRRAATRRKNRDGRPQPESGPRRKQRKQRGERVERGEVEDEPVQVAAELERERRQRSRPPEDRHLHAALAARFVAGAKNGPLGRLDRLEKTQRLLLARERALAPRQRGGAHFLERVEGLEVIAVGLAQVLDERELAAAAVAGALRPEAVPAIEAFEKDRFSRERGARRECARGVASFE